MANYTANQVHKKVASEKSYSKWIENERQEYSNSDTDKEFITWLNDKYGLKKSFWDTGFGSAVEEVGKKVGENVGTTTQPGSPDVTYKKEAKTILGMKPIVFYPLLIGIGGLMIYGAYSLTNK